MLSRRQLEGACIDGRDASCGCGNRAVERQQAIPVEPAPDIPFVSGVEPDVHRHGTVRHGRETVAVEAVVQVGQVFFLRHPRLFGPDAAPLLPNEYLHTYHPEELHG